MNSKKKIREFVLLEKSTPRKSLFLMYPDQNILAFPERFHNEVYID